MPFSLVTQLIVSRGVAVDECARASVCVHHATQQQPVRIALECLLAQPMPHRGQRIDGELCGHVRTFGPGAYLFASRAIAERQGQGVDQDRFSSSGLARQGGEARSKLELQAIDYCEVANGKVRKHSPLQDFAPVQLLAQHREVAVTGRMNELRSMLRAPDKDAVAL